MKDITAISLIGLIYGIVVSTIALIFFQTYAIWTVLGVIAIMFNHGLIVFLSQKRFSKSKFLIGIAIRYVVYLIVLAIVFFTLKDLGTNVLIEAYIFLLVGIISIKIGIFIYHMPFPLFKRLREKNAEMDETEKKEDNQNV